MRVLVAVVVVVVIVAVIVLVAVVVLVLVAVIVLVAVVVVVVVVVVAVVVAVVVVVVLERDRIDLVGEGEDAHAVLARGLERADEPLLEQEAVRDDEVRVAQCGRVRGGRLVAVRIDAGSHQDADGRVFPDELHDDVTDDRGGRDDRERLGGVGFGGGRGGRRVNRVAPGGVLAGPAGGQHERGRGQHGSGTSEGPGGVGSGSSHQELLGGAGRRGGGSRKSNRNCSYLSSAVPPCAAERGISPRVPGGRWVVRDDALPAAPRRPGARARGRQRPPARRP